MQKRAFLNLVPETPYVGVLGSNFEKQLSYLPVAPSNLPYCKIWCKNFKSLNFGPKILHLGIFGLEFENVVILEISNLEFAIAKFCEIKKIPKFGIKSALFGYFGLTLLKKTVVMFEISTLKFFLLQNFVKRQKLLNLGSKIPYLGIFD